ncbi:MAG: hypothetical protein AAEJ43_09595, partial [Gammaproteobacteria bacterium]
KNSSGTNFRDSPEGVTRRDALNKTMAHLDRYPNAARLHGCMDAGGRAMQEQLPSRFPKSDRLLCVV